MSQLLFTADVNIVLLKQKLGQIDADFEKVVRSAAKTGTVMEDAFSRAKQYALGYLSINFAERISRDLITVRGEFQKFESVLTNTLNGDNVKASNLLKGLSEFAVETPYQLQEITENFVKLANQGIVLTQSELKKLGDFAAVTGKPIGQLFEAIMDVNNPERWKEFGARIETEGEKVMISFRGQKIEFDRTIQGAKDAITQLGSMKGIEGTMNVISKTLIGQKSNFEDAWSRMMNKIGQSNEDMLSGMITGATGLVENYKTVIDILGAVVVTYGAGKAAAMLYNVVLKESAAINAMVAASNGVFNKSLAMQWLWTERTQMAQATLNKTMLANPYVLAAASIVGMVAGLVILNRKFEENIDANRRFEEQTKSLNNSYENRISQSDKLIRTVQSETEAESKRIEALRTLKDLYPDIFSEIDIHNAKLINSAELTKKITEAEAARNLQNQREYIASLTRDRDRLELRLRSAGNASLGEDGLANPFPIYDQRKLEQLNELIKKEGDRETQMIIDRVNAEQAQRNESEKTIQQRLKEADSIEKLGKLREQWEKKWIASTNDTERKKLKGELDLIVKSLDVLSGKAGKKEIEGEYAQLLDQIKKASDAVINASKKERPVLQNELALLVTKKEAYEDIIKAQRGETIGMKPVKALDASIDPKPVENATLEVNKLGNLIDKTKKKAAELKKELKYDPGMIDIINERYEKQKQIIEETLSFIDQAVSRYGEMLGLSEDQQKSLENGLNSFKGMAQIASGNVIQGSFTMLASLADSLIKSPEKLSEAFESVEKNIQKIIKSVELAETTLGNLNKGNTANSLTIIKAQLLDLADSAKALNTELSKSSTGRRRPISDNLPNIVQQAADINAEIEKLSNRLLKGDISDDQRKSIETILDSYNSLLAKIDSTIQEITGTTVYDLSRSLSDAIIDGADAWNIWEQKANEVIRNVISKQLTQQVLNKPITDAVNSLVNDSSDGLSPDEAKEFEDTIKTIYEVSKPVFDATIASMRNAGINISSSSVDSAMTGITASLTEETGSLIAGIGSAMRIDLKELGVDVKSMLDFSQNGLEILDQQLSVLNQIAKNTHPLYRLESMENELRTMNKTLNERL